MTERERERIAFTEFKDPVADKIAEREMKKLDRLENSGKRKDRKHGNKERSAEDNEL